ncbi:hypothetical protein [Marinobacter sp. F4218]|uniref:hypothetical protein n=1 Tax=Marinobacter sp. F4218 TaxID=2862868 RepID=UPI001C62E450|nr:hypothetical protein [Marinobacter sp. F4218]MBW7470447.1 hypothetical protein [Marinobacter sp. F4218]
MKAINFKNSLLFLSFFSLILINHTIYAWSLGLGLLLIFIIIYRVPISKKASVQGFIFFTLILVSALRFQVFLIDDALPIFSDAFLGKVSGLVLCVLIFVALRSLLASKERRSVFRLLKPLLTFHVSVFYLQFFTYFLSGYYIDFLTPFTGDTSRYLSFDSSLGGVGSFRPTGFFAEPSNYFMCVLALLSLILVHEGFEKNKKLFTVSLLSMYLSFSTAAVIIATLFLGYYLYVQRLKIRTYIGIAFVSMIIFIFNASTIETLYQSQVDKADRSSASRFKLIELVLERENPINIIFGGGIFLVDSKIYDSATSKDFGSKAAAINDSGLIVFMWIQFGYMGFFIFLYFCMKEREAGRHRLSLFLLLSLTKISLFYPLFIFYMVVSLEEFNDNN